MKLSHITFGVRHSLFLATLLLTSCNEILEVPSTDATLGIDVVFKDAANADAAVTGIYIDMLRTDGFASGAEASITLLASLSADQLITSAANTQISAFWQNNIPPANPYASSLWNSAYRNIYQANVVIERLALSPIPTAVKNHLTGEALFIRAFCHFYLVNLFGDVPLITTTAFATTAHATRQPAGSVYSQIEADLLQAQKLLNENYNGGARTRANKHAATALLARVYLYQQNWAKAEANATQVIDATNMYSLPDLNQVFLKNSTEAIWQLQPIASNANTNEGYLFIAPSSNGYLLPNEFLNTFETYDNRANAWVGRLYNGNFVYYYPFKYKIRQGSPVTEYSMVLRLAEQYLIRAEALTQQNKLTNALKDIDAIRYRAGLPKLSDIDPTINQSKLLLAIEAERHHELFTEWGHRWLDLKRTDRAMEVLENVKDDLTKNDLLYPIPEGEFELNPNLGKQNDGY